MRREIGLLICCCFGADAAQCECLLLCIKKFPRQRCQPKLVRQRWSWSTCPPGHEVRAWVQGPCGAAVGFKQATPSPCQSTDALIAATGSKLWNLKCFLVLKSGKNCIKIDKLQHLCSLVQKTPRILIKLTGPSFDPLGRASAVRSGSLCQLHFEPFWLTVFKTVLYLFSKNLFLLKYSLLTLLH